MFIIANIVFILFYLQVEPVYLRVSNKPIQITSCVINIGNNQYSKIRFLKRWKDRYALHRNRGDGLANFGLSDVYFQKMYLY